MKIAQCCPIFLVHGQTKSEVGSDEKYKWLLKKCHGIKHQILHITPNVMREAVMAGGDIGLLDGRAI